MKTLNMKQPRKINHIRADKEGYCKKVYFGSKQQADNYIAKLQKESTRSKVPVRSYLCYKCNSWHLTSWEAPDIENLICQINEDIDCLNADLEREYENDTRIMSTALNDVIDLKRNYTKLELENRILKSKINQ